MSRCGATPLDSQALRRELASLELSPWVLSNDSKSLSRSFVAKDWSAAMAFLNSVSTAAEAANHHPDVHLTNWRDVRLVLSTHSAGGLTQQDFDLAATIDRLPVEYSAKWLKAQKLPEGDEAPAAFDRDYYSKGLNADFLIDDRDQLLATFAGGVDFGGGKFEDPELRDIAAAKDDIIAALNIGPGSVVADIGAGTGLLETALADKVGPEGKVLCSELSPTFRAALQDRLGHLANVEIIDDSTELDPGLPHNSIDLALMIDVYHHLEYPRTVLRKVRDALKRHGAFVVVDFHRDHKRVKSRAEDWVYAHVRADQQTFHDEIASVGFTQVADIDLPLLPENYFLVFRKKPIPLDVPGAGWA